MRRTILMFAAAGILFLVGSPAAMALGPVDGEVAVIYWVAETDDSFDTFDAYGPGVRGEVWFMKKLGVSAELFDLDVDLGGPFSDASLEYQNLDVKWRPFSPTENTFVAFGLGWQQIEVEDLDTSGARLVVEGRIGIAGFMYFYGRGAYFPSLDDIEAGGFTFAEDVDGREIDLGLAFEPAPFLSIWVGYRTNEISFTEVGFGGVDLNTSGPYVGAGVHF
jgi:hypothetical protein